MRFTKTMRKGVSMILAAAMISGLTACGGAKKEAAATAAAAVETTAASTTAASTVAAETTKAETEAPEKKETAERVLRMDAMSNAGYPAPYLASSKGAGYAVLQYIFDTLVWKDYKGFVNYLAESYSVSDDNKTYTFKLRPGVKFNDGEPFTAEDVKFTFDYMTEHPYSWVSTSSVKEVRVVDELTVEIELNKVYVAFIADVAANLPMLPKHIYEKVEDPTTYTEKDAFVGTGPMMLESYDAEAGVYTYVKNPNYFYGDVQIDRLILSPYEDPKTALLNGDIDAATTTSYKQAVSMKGTDNITVLEGQSLWLCRMYFNFDNEALATKEVRQAISYAINRQEILDKAFNGAGIAGTAGYVHPESPWYNANVTVYDQDVEKAKTLLADAGAADSNGDGILEFKGEPMSYELLISDKDESMAEMLKAYLAEVGIELTVKSTDDNTVKSLIQEGNFTIIANGHGSFGGDPKYMACLATDTDGAAKVTTQGGTRWQNDEYDRIFAESLQELDQTKREELVDRLQEIVADELPTIVLYYKSNASAYNNTVFDGFYYTMDGISSGIPYLYNKLILTTGTWKAE